MTDNLTTVIRVAVSNRDGMLFASSKDVYGLHICARNDDELCERLKVSIKWLFKQNRNLDINVIIPTTPSEFPQRTNRVLEELVIAAAA